MKEIRESEIGIVRPTRIVELTALGKAYNARLQANSAEPLDFSRDYGLYVPSFDVDSPYPGEYVIGLLPDLKDATVIALALQQHAKEDYDPSFGMFAWKYTQVLEQLGKRTDSTVITSGVRVHEQTHNVQELRFGERKSYLPMGKIIEKFTADNQQVEAVPMAEMAQMLHTYFLITSLSEAQAISAEIREAQTDTDRIDRTTVAFHRVISGFDQRREFRERFELLDIHLRGGLWLDDRLVTPHAAGLAGLLIQNPNVWRQIQQGRGSFPSIREKIKIGLHNVLYDPLAVAAQVTNPQQQLDLDVSLINEISRYQRITDTLAKKYHVEV